MQSICTTLLLTCMAVFTCATTFAQGSEEGAPITIKLSPAISIPGRTVKLNGTTLVAKSAVDLQITITHPKGTKENLTIKTDSKGAYSASFANTKDAGWYAFKVITADKKNSATDSLYIGSITNFSYGFAGTMAKFTEASQSAITLVEDKIAGLPATTELTEFESKCTQLKKQLNGMRAKTDESITELAKTIKEMSDVPKVMEKVDTYLQQLDEWNEQATNSIEDVQQQLAASKSKATTCENLNNVAELIGAVSLCLNLQGKLLEKCINLGTDKVLPGLVDRATWNGDNAIVEAKKIAINESQRTLTASARGTSSMVDFIKKSFVMDMVQFATKVLYAQLCTEIKGPANVNFKAEFEADNGAKYWTYDVNLNGNLTLRYDKKADLNQAVTVTGEFEGVRTGYKFWEDFEQVEKVPKGMLLYARIKKSPSPIDLSAFGNDLGMVARNLVPGSYRVKVKGRVVNNKLTLEFDDSPFDMVESARKESNKLFVICVNPILPIPMVKRFDFPIASSKVIFLHGLGKTHDFALTKSGQKVLIKDNVSNKKDLSNNSVHLNTSVSLDMTN